jgi:hypothetical protein
VALEDWHRLTQDLTYVESDKDLHLSVNSRIDMEALSEMIHGWCLPRILHFCRSSTPYAWTDHPHREVHRASDGRRIAHSAEATAQTITTLGPFGLHLLTLIFGAHRTSYFVLLLRW